METAEEDTESIVVDIIIPKAKHELLKRVAREKNLPVETVAKEYVRWKLLQP